MTTNPPPPALATGNYTAGTKIGMGKTASWEYPFVILRKDWTCAQYNTTDPVTGNPVQALTIPTDGEDGDYFWPEWSDKVDYGDKQLEPRCGWRVAYNGLYYTPSIWLSSAQRGKNPVVAMCDVDQDANWRYQYGANSTPKQVLKNKSHSIRAWICGGSYLEYNQWEDSYYFYQAYDPETGEYRHTFTPYSFIESVFDPDKIGGSSKGGYYFEKYWPSPTSLREMKVEKNPSFYDPSRTQLVPDVGQKDDWEPIGFNPLTGKMGTKGILEKNPYTLTGLWSGHGGYELGAFIGEGCSAKLWYQKTTQKYSDEKKTTPNKTDSGVQVDYQSRETATVTSSPMPAGKGYLVDFWGWWTGGVLYGPGSWYAWSASYGTPQVVNLPYESSTKGTLGIYVTVPHPLALTRNVKMWATRTTYNVSYKKHYDQNYSGPPPVPWYWVMSDYQIDVKWITDTLSFTYSNEPMNVGGTDKNGKYFNENTAHRIKSFQYEYGYKTSADNPSTYQVNQQLYGEQQWLDD